MTESSGPASQYLVAGLEERKLSRFKALLAVAESAVSGDLSGPALYDLVVRRVDTGREVLRTRADMGDPGFLLEEVRADLAALSVAEFLDEWRIRETPPTQ